MIVFQAVMYGYECLTTKKAEYQRTDFFWTVVLEKTLESPLSWKEIKPVNPQRNQSWIFIGKTNGKVEAPVFWPPDEKSWLTGLDHDVGKV